MCANRRRRPRQSGARSGPQAGPLTAAGAGVTPLLRLTAGPGRGVPIGSLNTSFHRTALRLDIGSLVGDSGSGLGRDSVALQKQRKAPARPRLIMITAPSKTGVVNHGCRVSHVAVGP